MDRNNRRNKEVKKEPTTAVVVGSPWAGTSTVFSILDVLGSVGRDWQILHGVPSHRPAFLTRLSTLDGKPYEDINGRRVTPDERLCRNEIPRLVIVPDLHVDPHAPLPDGLDGYAEWLRLAWEGGAMITSVCSGALLLAATGLLDGYPATTHWGVAHTLKSRFPRVELQIERILVPAGQGHRLVTAGGASAWADLMLYLIGRLVSPAEARRIAKVYLLQPHLDGQMCFASLSAGRQHEDQLVADAQVWAARHYDESNPVSNMAVRSGMSQRGFHRRFKKATGQSPVKYLQTLRVEEAKQMLETTKLSIEEVAEAVGYSEPSSFRSAFRRHVGISASVYRRQWQGSVDSP